MLLETLDTEELLANGLFVIPRCSLHSAHEAPDHCRSQLGFSVKRMMALLLVGWISKLEGKNRLPNGLSDAEFPHPLYTLNPGCRAFISRYVRARTDEPSRNAQPDLMTPPRSYIEDASKYSTGVKFAHMSRAQKFVFVAKIVACIATFGFAFPNVQSD